MTGTRCDTPHVDSIGRLGSHWEQAAVSDRTQPDNIGSDREQPLRVIPSERPVGETGVDGSKTAPLAQRSTWPSNHEDHLANGLVNAC